MLSLYIHIPFCIHKCHYCSFFVMPEELVAQQKIHIMKQQYTSLLLQQIATRKTLLPHEQIKTIYIWGGTPFQLGKENLTLVLETIFATRDCSMLEELSIELNPDPIDEILLFVQEYIQKRKDVFRIRFSFGIQSFDDVWLKESKRAYTYEQLPEFFRSLQKIKAANVSYNADFIAFWNRVLAKQDDDTYLPRWEEQRIFFEKLVASQLFDWFSVYTLELFPWSDRYNAGKWDYEKNDTVYDEFDRLASRIESHGYRRYELSNFALAGKRSIHNMVYRTMWSYLGLWINASSMLTRDLLKNYPWVEHSLFGKQLDEDILGVRFSVPDQWKTFQQATLLNEASIDFLDTTKRLRDELMLKLRTDQRISDWKKYSPILEKDREKQLAQRVEQWWMIYDEGKWRQMSSYGLDLYNSLITDLVVFDKKNHLTTSS